MAAAAGGGHMEEGCHWDAETCAGAAASGSLEALKWARDGGLQWDRRTCAAAAANGHLELEPQGDHRGGHLDVLQCLAALGCPCHAAVLSTASRNGRLAVLRRATVADCCP
eukprot:jgi/Tetstr1/463798/TSEL_008613.t1